MRSPVRVAIAAGVQSDVVVLVDESRNHSLRLQVVVSVVIVAVLPHRSVKSLDDSVRFRVTRPGSDVEQIVRFDDGAQLAVAELAAVGSLATHAV